MAKGPAVLREINEKRVLAFLRANKTSSRQEITQALQLGKNTVSLIVDKFMKEGVLVEVGLDANGVGRPRTQLALVPEVYQAVGILVRDSICEIVVTDYLGAIVESRQLVIDTRNVQQFLDAAVSLWKRLAAQYPHILGVGIAVPGLVDPLEGVVHYSSHLGWRNVAVRELLSAEIPVPIVVLNRVKAAALSPVKIVPEGAQSTFYIRIDEGVGGAFVIGNEVVHGFSRTAGEIGHIPVHADGPVCSCGQRGCLESLVAVPKVLDILDKQGVQLWGGDQLFNQFHDLAAHPRVNDKVEKVLMETGRYLGIAAAAVVNLLNPHFIVIDSPYNVLESFKQATLSSITSRALQYPSERTRVVFVQTALSSAWGMALSVIHQSETNTAQQK